MMKWQKAITSYYRKQFLISSAPLNYNYDQLRSINFNCSSGFTTWTCCPALLNLCSTVILSKIPIFNNELIFYSTAGKQSIEGMYHVVCAVKVLKYESLNCGTCSSNYSREKSTCVTSTKISQLTCYTASHLHWTVHGSFLLLLSQFLAPVSSFWGNHPSL